MTDNKSAQNTQ